MRSILLALLLLTGCMMPLTHLQSGRDAAKAEREKAALVEREKAAQAGREEAEHAGHEMAEHAGHERAAYPWKEKAPPMSFAQPIQVAEGDAMVRIVPMGSRTGGMTMSVVLRAETAGLIHPLTFHWSLGNGQEWDGPEPPPQIYIVGRYDVILTVTDANKRVRRASTRIDAESHGCAV